MWIRSEVKARGKSAFKANYWRSVLSAFLILLITGGTGFVNVIRSADPQDPQNVEQSFYDTGEAINSMSDEEMMTFAAILAGLAAIGFTIYIIFTILKIFVFNPLFVGCYGFFQENAAGRSPDLGALKTGFSNYKTHVIAMLLKDLFLFLWCCLLIFPGIIKSYSYRMVPFILRDYPELSAREAITMSRQMMNGHKWNTFVFDLSYLGWYILGAFTCGLLNIFWTEPYRQNANAALYQTLNSAYGSGYGGPYAGPQQGPYAGGYQSGTYAPNPTPAQEPVVTPDFPDAPFKQEQSAAPTEPGRSAESDLSDFPKA